MEVQELLMSMMIILIGMALYFSYRAYSIVISNDTETINANFNAIKDALKKLNSQTNTLAGVYYQVQRVMKGEADISELPEARIIDDKGVEVK